EYEDKVNASLIGTWHGKFEHLWLESDSSVPLEITVKIEKLNLTKNFSRLQDIKPLGEVILESRKTEKFSIIEVRVHQAFDKDGNATPDSGVIDVLFENASKRSYLNLRTGLFKNTYQRVELGGDTYGTFEKH
ncbi:MAG: hypothetical protein HYS98_03740, partial [Deltaproteobacteria bacterium]|nr:hypothetical protein [Deltaproteobacteria bacterium]